MDGRDMQRRVGGAARRAQERHSIELLRRNQGRPQGGSAAECLKAGRDPGWKLEPLRRGAGDPNGPAEAPIR